MWSAADLANAFPLLGLPFLAAIYHPGENGQVKKKRQVLLEAPALCTWCGWSGLSPARVLLQRGGEHPPDTPHTSISQPGWRAVLGTSCPL